MVSTLWMPLDSRLRGNDAVWCGEGFFVAHEPLYFNVMGTQPQPLRRALSAALTARAKTPRPPGCSQPGGRVFVSCGAHPGLCLLRPGQRVPQRLN
jgi:hypothetical protein